MEQIQQVLNAIEQVIIGKRSSAEQLLLGVLCSGHVLVEDVPGVGKTTLAKAMAQVLGCSFSRIQFTPDLMPSDILGLSLYDQQQSAFVYHPGPLMNHIVLADEINRTSPKTQSSLLEAMSEKHITVDGKTHELPDPFFVIATQNPVEYEGTYPLPEAQLDRFLLHVTMGYPEFDHEVSILSLNTGTKTIQDLPQVLSPGELKDLQVKSQQVYMAQSLQRYIVRLAQATREHSDVLLGLSPRGAQHIFRVAKALAFIRGMDHVLPDHIKEVVPGVCHHRIIIRPEARFRDITVTQVIQNILEATSVPVLLDD